MGNPFKAIGRWAWRVLIGLDQLGNTLLGGAPDETISARAARNREKNPAAAVLCGILDSIEGDHCQKAILSEIQGKQQAEEYFEMVLTVEEAEK